MGYRGKPCHEEEIRELTDPNWVRNVTYVAAQLTRVSGQAGYKRVWGKSMRPVFPEVEAAQSRGLRGRAEAASALSAPDGVLFRLHQLLASLR